MSSRLGGIRSRTIASRILLVIGALLLSAALLFAYASQNVFSKDQFSSHITNAVLSEPTVDYLAEEITDQLIETQPNLLFGRPVILDVVKAVLQTPLVEGLVEAAAGQLHATAFDENSDSVVLKVADLITLVRAQLNTVSPEIAELIPQELSDASVTLVNSDIRMKSLQLAENVKAAAVALPFWAFIFFALAVAIAPSKRDALFGVSITAAIAALLLLTIEDIARKLFLSRFDDPEARDTISAIWTEFLTDFRKWAWILLGLSLILGALVSSLLRGSDIVQLVTKLAQAIQHAPDTLVGSVARPVAAIVIGLMLLLEPIASLQFIAILVGAGLTIQGTDELLRKTPIPRYFERSAERQARLERPKARRALVWLGVGILIVLAAGSVAASIFAANRTSAAESEACNGANELCDRKLNEVVFAATHNSMSAATEGFVPPNHAKGMATQLRQGYRALLIDTWYGFNQGSYVYTGANANGPSANDEAETLGPDAVAAAERLRANASVRGERGLYLCHEFCEVGAVPFEPALAELGVWLKQNPREVLIIFIQDQITPEDTEAAFERADLVQYIAQLDLNSPMPTLLELIETNKRLIVMAENNAEGVDWYLDGFSFVQETPFGFTSQAEFSCALNRGNVDSPLFLVNHFFKLPLNSNNFINSKEVLLPRLQKCQEERGLLPNLVAVDFGESGDVIEVVNELNGLG